MITRFPELVRCSSWASNACLASEGQLWPLVTAVAEAVHLLTHLRAIGDAARPAGMHVCCVPHPCWEPGDDAQWS
jgi:hypothetical protein